LQKGQNLPTSSKKSFHIHSQEGKKKGVKTSSYLARRGGEKRGKERRKASEGEGQARYSTLLNEKGVTVLFIWGGEGSKSSTDEGGAQAAEKGDLSIAM